MVCLCRLLFYIEVFFFFKQKTAYEMRISDWSSDVCASDLEARDDGVWVSFEGPAAPAEPQRYDLVLQAVGRTPNGKEIDAQKAGVSVSGRGFIEVDRDRKSVVEGKSVSVRVVFGGSLILKTKKYRTSVVRTKN